MPREIDVDGYAVLDGYGRLRIQLDVGYGWRDITTYTEGWTLARGRRSRLDRFYASTLSLRLDNRDGRFSPWRAGGPYYEGGGTPERRIRPNVPIQVTARHRDGTIVPLFFGWVDSWGELASLHVAGRTSSEVVDVTASDGFKRLAQANQLPGTPAGAGELTGARVTRILDAASWPAGGTWRDLDTGTITMAATDLGQPALDELLDTALSEGGAFFMAGDGKATFLDRAAVDAAATVRATVANNGYPDALPLAERIRPTGSDSAIVNVARIGRTGGVVYVATDSASVTWHGMVTFARTDLNHDTDADSEDLAALLLGRASGAEFGIDEITLDPYATEPDRRELVWRALLELGPLDGLRVIYQPQGLDTSEAGDAALDVDAPIDEIRHEATPDSWVLRMRTAVVDEFRTVSVIGPPTGLHATRIAPRGLTWAWTIPGHGYDAVAVRLGSDPWDEYPYELDEWGADDLEPGTRYRFSVRGRLGPIWSDAASIETSTTRAPIGPPGPPGGGVDVPDPTIPDPGDVDPNPNPETCEWRYTLTLDLGELGSAVVQTGVVPAGAQLDWRPSYSYAEGGIYELCFGKWCGTPSKVQVGETGCYRWTEPASWDDPCDFADPPEGGPVFAIEICGPHNVIADAVSGTVFTNGPGYFGPTFGPFDPPDQAILTALGSGVAVPTAWATLVNVGGMGVNRQGFTLLGWTIGTATIPVSGYPILTIGSGDSIVVRAVEAAGASHIRLERVAGASTEPSGTRGVLDFDTGGANVLPTDGAWHMWAITYGDDGTEETARLYIDGAQVAELALTGEWGITPHGGYVELGGAPGHAYAHTSGFTRILTATEIGDLYGETPPPASAQVTAATTYVVPAAWIAVDGMSFVVPSGVQVWTQKCLWRRATGAVDSPPPASITDFQVGQWTDNHNDGSYAASGYGSDMTAIVTGWTYYGPGDTTSDGTVIPADGGAIYFGRAQGSGADDSRHGPDIITRTVTMDSNTIRAWQSGVGGDADLINSQRIDDVATHTTPLLPNPTTP